MLDFPTSPNVGDTYASWRWDGARWVRVGRGGGNGGGGPSGPQMGVTDGSNAQPGEVGEVISTSGTGFLGQVDNTGFDSTVDTLILTAGDWLISGWFKFNLASGTSTKFTAILETVLYSGDVVSVVHGWGANQQITNWMSVFPSIRKNYAVPTTIDVSMGTISTNYATTSWYISAVRIR